MWQRFTERARKVVFYAQEEAQKFGEGYVSTEHLLLGLVRESDSVAARVLEKLGVSLNRIRVEVEKQLPKGEARPATDMTLTPRAKRVIDLAVDEARSLSNDYIGTEHLLLGLIREGDGLAGRVLAKLGVELERARREVIALQDNEARKKGQVLPPIRRLPPNADFKPFLWSAFDDSAQGTMLRADEMAKGMDETHLTPLHLVLSLLAETDSKAIEALKKVGVTPEMLRAEVERHRTWAVDAPSIQFSPNGRKVMDAATLEAQALDSDRLGSEHLLLGLMRGNPDGVGRILEGFGVEIRTLRDAIQDRQSKENPPETETPTD